MKINQKLVDLLKIERLKISTAESVTGGNLIASIIEIPGASNVTEQSYIVYSNQAKIDVLGVNPETIQSYEVVSKEVALEMARRLQKISKADISISTTGEAGPNPSSENINIGIICFAIVFNSQEYTYKINFDGNRQEIIKQAVEHILDTIYKILKDR